MSIDECRLIDLPRIADVRGNLTFVEGTSHVPFDIKRVYYIYDVPGGTARGSHAHRSLEQLVVAASGSFDVIVADGEVERRFHLDQPYFGLYISPMMWRTLDNFSSGAVCLVLASERYDERDYVHTWEEYVSLVNGS